MGTIFRACLFVVAGVVLFGQNSANETCAGCHEQATKLVGMAHGSVACSQCHLKHEDYPHPAKIAKPACASCHQQASQDYVLSIHGQQAAKGNAAAPECSTCHQSAHEVLKPRSAEFRKSVPETCGMCHDHVADDYKMSVHGKAIARGELNAAVCTDCHGEHKILAPANALSPVHASHVRDTCGQCHGNVTLSRRLGIPSDRLTTFDASFHGLAAKGGAQTVANCASCHGVHNILRSQDAKSMTNPKHLAQTCGKCHPGAGTRFAIGAVHQAEGGTEHASVAWVRSFYLLVIPFTIVLMLLHNGGDLVRKLIRQFSGAPTRHSAARVGELRMLPYERLSHAMLAASFIILAYSGTALKFPDAFWAQPFAFFESSLQARRNIHRIAAVMMMAVSAMHVFGIIFSHRLRRHWTEMFPRFSDATDAAKTMAYNLGLTKRKPVLPSHGYVEKVEYWAVMWGTAVMVITGVLLWANNLSLRLLPKWILDVATTVHWYEAILASLAIVVWHFYSVIFDPDIYPMDFAWLTGRSSRATKAARPTAVESEEVKEPAEIVE